MHIHPVGTRALLIELEDLPQVMAWHAALDAHPLKDQVDAIAAATTLLLTFATPNSAAAAAERLQDFRPTAHTGEDPRLVEIDVLYDGDDLDEAAELMGMSREGLIEWHTSTEWLAAFGGFAPGFTYCTPADPEQNFNIERRATPRTAVPAGAVGIAGGFSAVYPRVSPGGWQLLGTTTTPMWESDAQPPALVQPGDRVRYRAVSSLPDVVSTTPFGRRTPARLPRMEVLDAGLLTLFQDQGRPGRGNLGVTPSGAADQAAAATANVAVGNPRGATVLENIGGIRLRALTDAVMCVTGAQSRVLLDDMPVALARPVLVTAGSTVTVEPATVGLRNYIAIRGGIVADAELGSASTDMLSGLGPQPVRLGDVIGVLPRSTAMTDAQLANPLRVGSGAQGQTQGVLRCVLGPRDDWFTPDSLNVFVSTEWTVTSQSNRVGVRLVGPSDDSGLERSREGELPSEGMVAGSVQVPPSGEPVIFLRDHAVTGGYPVIATVLEEDIDIAAQLPPGATVRFELA
ncbi:5-oxoprolinase/urea amidolyase family protein [Corynebacterium minutissimum]|uniref:5-oxoprolinase subunit B/C family protein n=1 Tax=Corynebacterium minutissimum TaxID=38301 RepID=UPI001EF20987|nr:5-oxoprolinase/urea amidolyase family protein [Corynebacterium minutissimum]MCG7230022.1 urea amidolyase family protein [Corynebacterium minutissimum]MCG7239096.1 urea amidolyase family protein [Corynebacterium minutissimum]